MLDPNTKNTIRKLGDKARPVEERLGLRQMTVTAVGAGTVSVKDANDDVIAGVKHLSYYIPVVNDVVWVIKNGNDRIVIGKIGTSDSGWISVSYQNGWVDYDAARPLRYRKVNGRLQFRGMIKSGTVTSAALTLPAGYRHGVADNLSFPVVSNNAFGSVVIHGTTGVVIPYVGSNTWFDLSNISYICEV